MDLLSRAVSYTDVWGATSIAAYNRIGQATSATATPPGGTASTTELAYKSTGKS